MKLIIAGAILSAAVKAAEIHVPIDCYQDTLSAVGKQEGEKITDKDLITGLSPTDHHL